MKGIPHKHQVSAFNKSKTFVTVKAHDYDRAEKALGKQTARYDGPVYLEKESFDPLQEMDLHPDIANHPKVKDAQKQHKQGFWNGNVDRNGNAIVHVNGKPHTVTNTDPAARNEAKENCSKCGCDISNPDPDCNCDHDHSSVDEIVDISRKNFTRPGTAKLNKALGKDKLKKDLEAMRAKLGKGTGRGPRDLRAGMAYEEVETLEELTAKEKQLVNQMYDKKGNLTPLGKKVFNHNKKPGDKGYVEHTSHAEKVLGEAAFDDVIADYLNENEITLHQYSELSEEELNELIGKVIGGAVRLAGKGVAATAKYGIKGAVGSGRLAKKAVINKQGNFRKSKAGREDKKGDRLEKQVKNQEMKRAQRDRMAALKKRQDDAESDLKAKQQKQTQAAQNPKPKKLGELDVSTLKSYAKKANKARAKAANSYMDAAARRYDFDDESPHQKNQAKIFDKRDKGYELAQKKIKKS